MKARNELYDKFRQRFTQNIDKIVQEFDAERKEEFRFREYWQQIGSVSAVTDKIMGQ